MAANAQHQQFDFIDLFAGIGGFRQAMEAVGGKCVLTSEYDRFCRETYEERWGREESFFGDIRHIDLRAVPAHDVLAAGFPCQPFSIAGVSKKNALGLPHGFECKTQGTLFYEIKKILDAKKPQAFILENVKNLVSHDGGNTFETIKDVLTDLKYSISYEVLDARYYVPQHRERIFIVGLRKAIHGDTKFDFARLNTPAQGPTLASVLHPQDGSEPAEDRFTSGKDATVLDKYTLSDKLWDYLQAYAAKHRARGNGFGFGLVRPEDVARTLSARYYKDGSEILVDQPGRNPRRLTPRECARLMGFDPLIGSPGWNDPERRRAIPVSNTQAYKQFGNSVAVPLVTEIASTLRDYLAPREP